MEPSATDTIVAALTRAIVEHRLQPGAKLTEQTLAGHFDVSRTLVRQALFQLSQRRLVTLEPARGAFVASPSAEEARQVFAVRRMLEVELTRAFVAAATPAHIDALRDHVAREQAAVQRQDVEGRTELLGDFHVLMAELLGNHVLADVLQDLLARCAIATLMYQSSHAAHDSSAEHAALVECFAAGNVTRAVKLMREHLDHVEAGLKLDQPVPSHDVKSALAPV
ncbi:MAG: GntR family transcriptional regulator [Ottowia sp.]|jgi:DNA-binding GntR family transcriptional regulator|nr:GntR family transcriptional regulator [Ottowia sp.]MBP7457244.1 GntR family transcriptional regulator [Ottowia sp.]MBP8860056.1 GntR family transcriptional regulator [Ottowia sp.]MBP8894427.1 GntR family transcriptional regulator [Ottowia sp.]MBP9522028.1 GntR family transcriptional regulator [Ottowia sp.]